MAKVVSFEEVGLVETYDLEVDHPDHQYYLSNGVLTSNSHAVAYTLLSFYEMYLKCYFPQEFWCACLESASEDAKKDESVFSLKPVIEEDGLQVIYPSIHNFAPSFEPVGDDKIVWPMKKIKGIGAKANDLICEDGRRSFSSIEEMAEALPLKQFNTGAWTKLIAAGFFDPIGEPWEVIPIIENALGREIKLDKENKDPYYWQLMRNDAYGFQITSWRELLQPVVPVKIPNITTKQFNKIPNRKDGILIFGKVTKLEVRKGKKGYYAVCKVEDLGKSFSVKLWNSYWEDESLDRDPRKKRIREDDIVMIMGQKNIWSPPDSDNVYHSVTVGDSEVVEVIRRKS